MKDYTLNENDREIFIQKYKVNNDKIIVYLASGYTYIIDNTEENIKKLDEQLTEQVVEFAGIDKSSIFEKRRNKFILGAVLSFIAVPIIWFYATAFGYEFTQQTALMIISYFLESSCLTLSAFAVYNDIIVKDMKKNNKVLDVSYDKDKINETVLNNSRKKVNKELVKDNEIVFKLNNCDKLSYNDIKKIENAVLLESSYDFEVKPKIKTLTKNNK